MSCHDELLQRLISGAGDLAKRIVSYVGQILDYYTKCRTSGYSDSRHYTRHSPVFVLAAAGETWPDTFRVRVGTQANKFARNHGVTARSIFFAQE
jgi:hypothetical protein